jgi:hypothetical protein
VAFMRRSAAARQSDVSEDARSDAIVAIRPQE